MKKGISMFLSLALALSLTACQTAQTPPTQTPPPLPSQSATPSPALVREYVSASRGYAFTELVKMKDGAEIFCIIVKPEKEGQFPTVITQNCYQEAAEEYTAEYIEKCVADSAAFVDAGYAFVLMQSRGNGNSSYESYLPYIHDTDDELQVFDWIRAQDFYNGELFCNGMSYMGFTSMSSLYAPHGDIKAISMQCPVSTRYDAWYQNGFMKIGLMGYWQAWKHRPAGFQAGVLGTAMDMTMFNTFPYLDWPMTMYGTQEPYWTGIITHPEDGDWWRTEAAGSYIYDAIASIDVPVLLFENFYDIFFEDSHEVWNTFSPEQKAQSAFVVSQFGHTYAGAKEWPLNIGDSATPAYNADYVVDFFNSVRAGTKPTKVELGSVTYYPVDGDQWYSEKGDLTNGSREHVLYLNKGTLDAEAAGETAITYIYDPKDPALFQASDENGGNGTNGYNGLAAEPLTYDRQDIITFQGVPAEQETYIKGKPSADLTVSSDREDTCFLVRVDVVKDGVAYNLREDITSLSYQLGSYTPGEKAKLSFETGAVACKLNPGDYLRVVISSSAAGMYSIHTNVAGNQWEIADPVVAENTVYTGSSSFRYYTEDLAG